MVAHFQIPLNLPHAGTIVRRIDAILGPEPTYKKPDAHALRDAMAGLREILEPYRLSGENSSEREAKPVVEKASQLARVLAKELVRLKLTGDRIGQCVRNLFECLELGEEGAQVSLDCGENPKSAARPI
jgi:hypothetical protein